MPSAPCWPDFWQPRLPPRSRPRHRIRGQLAALGDAGLDRRDITTQRGAAAGKVAVEVVLTRGQAAKLNSQGFGLTEKRVDGAAVSQRLEQQAAGGYTGFRPYGEPGGIKDELVAISRQYPQLTKLVRIGRSVRGQDILAVKVTKGARKVADGERPSVLYSSTQHARE